MAGWWLGTGHCQKCRKITRVESNNANMFTSSIVSYAIIEIYWLSIWTCIDYIHAHGGWCTTVRWFRLPLAGQFLPKDVNIKFLWSCLARAFESDLRYPWSFGGRRLKWISGQAQYLRVHGWTLGSGPQNKWRHCPPEILWNWKCQEGFLVTVNQCQVLLVLTLQSETEWSPHGLL